MAAICSSASHLSFPARVLPSSDRATGFDSDHSASGASRRVPFASWNWRGSAAKASLAYSLPRPLCLGWCSWDHWATSWKIGCLWRCLYRIWAHICRPLASLALSWARRRSWETMWTAGCYVRAVSRMLGLLLCGRMIIRGDPCWWSWILPPIDCLFGASEVFTFQKMAQVVQVYFCSDQGYWVR